MIVGIASTKQWLLDELNHDAHTDKTLFPKRIRHMPINDSYDDIIGDGKEAVCFTSFLRIWQLVAVQMTR